MSGRKIFLVSLANNGERKSANAAYAITIFQTLLRGEDAETDMLLCTCTFLKGRREM